MSRAPFQVLVLPFRRTAGDPQFAALCRSDTGDWQGIAGGGDAGETPEQAAVRESFEEAGIPFGTPFLRLDSICSVPVQVFEDRRGWSEDLFVIPEHAFGVDCTSVDLRLSEEHAKCAWGTLAETLRRLRWDSNKTALYELSERIRTDRLGASFTTGAPPKGP